MTIWERDVRMFVERSLELVSPFLYLLHLIFKLEQPSVHKILIKDEPHTNLLPHLSHSFQFLFQLSVLSSQSIHLLSKMVQ